MQNAVDATRWIWTRVNEVSCYSPKTFSKTSIPRRSQGSVAGTHVSWTLLQASRVRQCGRLLNIAARLTGTQKGEKKEKGVPRSRVSTEAIDSFPPSTRANFSIK